MKTRYEVSRLAPARGLLLAFVVAAGACATGAGNPGAPRGGTAVDDPFSGRGSGGNVEVTVQNSNDYAAELVALTSDGQVRLGAVRGGDQDFFTWRIAGETEVAIGIRLRSGETHRTNTVRAQPGDHLRLRIGRMISSSSLRR